MLASSSRRETAGTADKSRQSKKVGCMSGIFYLLHFHRHHSRKRLPSPGTRDSKTTVITAPAPALPTQPEPKPTAAAAAEPGQKTPRKKRASRQQVPSPASVAAGKPPAADKYSSNSKRSAPHEAAPPPAAAAGPGGKTSHNKRAAPRPEVAALDHVVAKFGEKTSIDKRAAPASPPAAGGSPGGGLSRRLSCDVPRSPTLSSEIRRSNSAGNAARKPPALVARLMGLDAPPPLPPVDCTPESAAEKRRKLLGALERCDEDLRTLKNIIEALRITESSQKAPTAGQQATPKRSDSGHAGAVEDKRCLDVEGEQPSPVSVLDALSSPPARRRFNNGGAATMAKGGLVVGNQRGEAAPPAVRSKQQPCPVFAPLPQPGRHDKEARVANGQSPLFHRDANLEALPRGAAAAGRTTERPFLETSYYSELRQRRGTTTSHPWLQRLQHCSRAMEESVDQVWKDGAREERWELGSVAVALEADVLGDLVAELVEELGFRRYCSSSRLPPLPFDGCRKRLCY